MTYAGCWPVAHLVSAHDELLCHLASHAHINPGQQLLLARAELVAQRHLHTGPLTMLHRELGLTTTVDAVILSQEAGGLQMPSLWLAEPPCGLTQALCCEKHGGSLDGGSAGTGVPLVGSRHALHAHMKTAGLTVETMPRAWPRGTIVAL